MIDAAWAEIAHHCAYSLPAVALTLGRKFWPCLKETFDALSSDLKVNLKNIYSFHVNLLSIF